ncbi:MAG: riboflavin biosynthesis protein RibD protein [Frankiales bacterium]|nr:riboflavin biosynthesis protein RibD protein [Frankiales bacterium]
MNRVIVIEFITLDGVIEDPDGSAGTPGGGWAFRHGPEAVAGDKFRLDARLDTGTLLLGRRTWQLFARIWPQRSDPFSTAMNRIPKAVASRTLTDLGAWSNSTLLAGDVAGEVPRLRDRGDVIVAGSVDLVQILVEKDLVDEYRLLVFPTVLGAGRSLFGLGTPPTDLRLLSVEQRGAAVLMRHERNR